MQMPIMVRMFWQFIGIAFGLGVIIGVEIAGFGWLFRAVLAGAR